MDSVGIINATTRFINDACREIAANMQYMTEHRILEAHKARNDVRTAGRLLSAWRRERPFLYIAQCPYAQALVWEMIHSYLRAMLFVRFPYDESMLADMYRLLEEGPPRYDPLNYKAPRSGAFYCKKQGSTGFRLSSCTCAVVGVQGFKPYFLVVCSEGRPCVLAVCVVAYLGSWSA